MVENNDLKSESIMNLANVKLITEGKKLLDETTLSIQLEIKTSFEHLIGVLKSREKQLLRQVEAVHVQQLSLIQSNLDLVSCKPLVNIDLSSRYDIESQILHLGKLKVFGKNCMSVKDTEPYKVQEYQDADKDHESFNKSIKSDDNIREVVEKQIEFEANVSACDENTQTYNNGMLNCSCNSSLNSSSGSENKSNDEFSTLSMSNCTVIDKRLFFSNNESSPEAGSTEPDSLLDLTNENSRIDIPNDLVSSGDSKELYSKNITCDNVTNVNFYKDVNANKGQGFLSIHSVSSCEPDRSRQIRRDSGEHPKQIQQWLQQILVETETEPMVHEIEQFSEISKARLSGQFPLET
ncbi:uncharacterized protein LOC124180421 [Neodiprion fabricii]|uniref:uncharacterized protein LOC124180421 n=1 Tax=Neodiprion fabricii TaxID=2872261 RepID=UPI001ED8E56F|nr:uncharacterized protein LOC124180421 [Neodiprion fabricii]